MARSGSSHAEDVFSLDLSTHNSNHFAGRDRGAAQEILQDETLISLVALLSSHTAFEEKLLQAVRRYKAVSAVLNNAADCAVLAQLLTDDGFWMKQHGPGTENSKRRKGNCLETLSHNYLTCYGHVTIGKQEEVIIEPRLKDQFQIAHPTDKFTAFLAVLPHEFVGTARKLAVVVEHISQEAARAFQEQGMALPPWRRTAASLSKWALEPSQASDRIHEQLNDAKAADRSQPMSTPPLQQQAVPLRPRRSSEFSTTPNKPKNKRVSALARGLADLQPSQRSLSKRRPEASNRSDKLKRVFSWDFSGLQPITTVRRSGKAH